MRSLLRAIGKSSNLAKPTLLVMTGYSSEVMVGGNVGLIHRRGPDTTSPFSPMPRKGRKRIASRVGEVVLMCRDD